MIEKGIREARQDFTRLLKRVSGGEEIVITDRGRPVAQIVPIGRHATVQLRSRAALRASVRRRGRRLSEIVIEDREGL